MTEQIANPTETLLALERRMTGLEIDIVRVADEVRSLAAMVTALSKAVNEPKVLRMPK